MKIGVSGASGNLGSATITELLSRSGDHVLVGISRSPEKVSGVEARVGDYDRPETLAAAYAGLDRLLLIPSGDMVPGARSTQLKSAIDVAVAAGVGHIYLVSAAGTREAALPSLGAEYWLSEQHLIRTAPRWTILRMNYYAEAIVGEMLMSKDKDAFIGLGAESVAYVARTDLAAMAAGALLTEGHAGAIYNGTGAEVISGEDRAALAGELLGKSFAFAALPEEVVRGGMAQMGLPEPVVNAIVEIKSNFVAGYFDVLTHDVERLSGRKPKTLRTVFSAMLA